MTPLERITERVTRLGHPDSPDTPRPLLTIDEFFQGNGWDSSIGCNMPGPPGVERFYALFKEIEKQPNVKDVRVQITYFDDPRWPFTDTIFVMTSDTPEVVESWFPKHLRPDIVESVDFKPSDFEPYEMPPGTKPICCWWD